MWLAFDGTNSVRFVRVSTLERFKIPPQRPSKITLVVCFLAQAWVVEKFLLALLKPLCLLLTGIEAAEGEVQT